MLICKLADGKVTLVRLVVGEDAGALRLGTTPPVVGSEIEPGDNTARLGSCEPDKD